jgi:hypothetical protein
VIAVIYVDDVLFYSKSDDAISKIIKQLQDSDIAIRREKDAAGFLELSSHGCSRYDRGTCPQHGKIPSSSSYKDDG